MACTTKKQPAQKSPPQYPKPQAALPKNSGPKTSPHIYPTSLTPTADINQVHKFSPPQHIYAYNSWHGMFHGMNTNGIP
jgi:hypothetical protein